VSERFATGANLTHESAKAALSAGVAQIAAGATAVDCAALTQFDSSALAVLIAWQRAARERGTAPSRPGGKPPRNQTDASSFQGQAGVSDLAYNQPFFGRCLGAKSIARQV